MNTTRNFKIGLESLLDLPLDKVKENIIKNEKCLLKDLKFLDLLTIDETKSKDKALRQGVYLFFDSEGKCLYVGKSQSFAQRIGEHFGMSPKNSRNKFLKAVVKKLRTPEECDAERYQVYVKTVKEEIGDYGLLIIAVNRVLDDDCLKRKNTGKIKLVKKLEKTLIGLLQPCLNKRNKKYKPPKPDGTLRDNLP